MPRTLLLAVLTAVFLACPAGFARAHCDALDGPVAVAARAALDAGDVTPVLRWVHADKESEVRAAFARTVAVRSLGADARAVADTWFLETLVRLHREGEGYAFDGLKPAGRIDPVVAMVDASLSSGSADDLLGKVVAHVSRSLRERYQRAREAAAHADDSVEAGRAAVASYVEYVHFVEALHKVASGQPHGQQTTAAAHAH